MKRKLFLLTAIILSFSLVLTACGQKDIGEAKAKKLALDSINKLFQTNQTEATVTREQMGCLPDQVGAMATNGNAGETSRWVYIVNVPLNDATAKYESLVIAATGEVVYLSQNSANIILTDKQEAQAYQLYKDEKKWGEKHYDALLSLKEACKSWAIANLNESHPVILEVNRGRMPSGTISTTFGNEYYIVTQEAKVYYIAIEWPSMQPIVISVENVK